MPGGPCGHENPVGSRFCATCGTPFAPAKPATPAGSGKLTVQLPELSQPKASPAGSPAPKSAPRPRRRAVIVATIIGLLVALAASTFAVVAVVTRDEAGAEVYLEAAARRGPDPFTDSVANDTTELTSPYEATGEAGQGVVLTVTGTEPGLYGGTRDNTACDPTKLVEFLEAQPAKARAWAGILGINPTGITDYINALTPVILRADTRVTNHGFANGNATARQAVLQSGTAVLVDNTGIPRVRCSCGNPLTEPEAVEANYAGTPWPDFQPDTVIAITTGQETDTLTLTDLGDGSTFDQPAGVATTDVIAIGTDDGLVLVEDGKLRTKLLAGQAVMQVFPSPDKATLALTVSPTTVSETTELMLLQGDGQLSTVLSTGPASLLGWRPDGRLMYAEPSETGDSVIHYVVDAEPGATPEQLDLAAEWQLAVSSDGKWGIGYSPYGSAPGQGFHWIDFTRTGRWEVMAPGLEQPFGDLEEFDCGVCDPQWSPKGARVAIGTGTEVWTAAAGGTFTASALGAPSQTASAFANPLWVDENRVVLTWEGVAEPGLGHQVAVVDTETDEARDLGPGIAAGANGSGIVVAELEPETTGQLVLVDPATGERAPLDGGDLGFALSSRYEQRFDQLVSTEAVVVIRGRSGDALDSVWLVDTDRATATLLPGDIGGQVLAAATAPAGVGSAVQPQGDPAPEPAAGPKACGIVTNALGDPTRVSVKVGAITCADAERLADTYYNDPPETPQGSGANVQIDAWWCSSTSGTVYERTEHAGSCEGPGGEISLDRP